MKNESFTSSYDGYYNIEKSWVIQNIPIGENRVFDLGCATGVLGKRLKEMNKASEVVGAEIFEFAAQEALKYYDKVYIGDVEDIDIEFHNYFDYVVCGDILEHLRDPWKMLKRIHGWLKEDGILHISIPNVRYWRLLRDLIIFGKWEYRDAGILDRTHLRFFAKKDIITALSGAHFEVLSHKMWINGKKQGGFNALTLGLFKEFLGSQIVVSARRRS
jgi:2-polyprenyl-3-methyl-5-hydroxy-6-metoxy-1,4-benzoquinol methylase